MKNAVIWFEIYVNDFERAKKFYQTILKQQIKEQEFPGMRMAFFDADWESGGIGGSIVKNPQVKPSPDGTVVYLNVDGDMDGVLSRIPSAGGSIMMPKTEIPPHGFIALFLDSEGNKVGLHSK